MHGLGGSGQTELNIWNSILPDHILIAPTGYLNSWNTHHEESKAPDLSMLQELFAKLKVYENVDGSKIRIIGFSNGAALANRAYISLDESGIDQIVTIATTFSSLMYREGNFHIPTNEISTGTSTTNYPIIRLPFKPRKFINFHGLTDTSFPYAGGFKTEFGYTFLSAQASAYAVAKS